MYVIKRNGEREQFAINKVINRIVNFDYANGMETKIVLNLNNRIYSGISTKAIDDLLAEISIKMANSHSSYGRLASNLLLNNIYKSVEKSFTKTMQKIKETKNDLLKASTIADDVYRIIQSNSELFDTEIEQENDLK